MQESRRRFSGDESARQMPVELTRSPLYSHPMTRMAYRALFAGLLALSLTFTVIPTRTAAATPAKSSCCARMKMSGSANDCGKHSPKSQDRDCCVACANCLTLYLPSQQPFNFSPSLRWILALTSMRENSRTERPPVPPPRSAVV